MDRILCSRLHTIAILFTIYAGLRTEEEVEYYT